MKHVFLLLTLLFSVTLFAQDPINEDEDVITDGYNPYAEPLPELPPIPCYVNGVAHVSEIRLSDGRVLVAIRFVDPIAPGTQIGDAFTGSALQATNAGTHELLVVKSSASQTLRVHLNNECGQALFADLQSPYNPEQTVDQQTINVSREMGELVNMFISRETPLWEVLRDDATVSTYEKLAFYQQYALDKMPLPINEELINGDKNRLWGTVGPLFRVTSECKCSVLRYSSQHLPGWEIGSNPPAQIWEAKIVHPIESKQPGGGGTLYWKTYRALGPAKWLSVHTEGFKTPCTRELVSEFFTGDWNAPNTSIRGQITMNLLCMDGNQLPSKCACDKKGFFSYRYDVTLDAKAITHHVTFCAGDRKSGAQAQDRVGVYCTIGVNKDSANVDNLISIDGMESKVAAKCNTPINPEFWPTINSFGANVIDVFTDKSGKLFKWKYKYRRDTLYKDSIFWNTQKVPPGNDTVKVIASIRDVKIDSSRVFSLSAESEQYKNLLSSIIKVIQTRYFDTTTCNNVSRYQQLQGFMPFTLKPNTPLRFVMINHAAVRASGRRAWYSYAQVVSAYNMAVTLNPGQTEGENSRDCCSPWSGAYLMAQPFSLKEMDRDVASNLFLFGGFNLPDNLIPNSPPVNGASGWMERPADASHCKVKIEGRNNEKSDIALDDWAKNIAQQGAQIQVYDVAGRLMGQFEVYAGATHPLQSIYDVIRQNLPANVLYFVQAKTGATQHSFRFFNSQQF